MFRSSELRHCCGITTRNQVFGLLKLASTLANSSALVAVSPAMRLRYEQLSIEAHRCRKEERGLREGNTYSVQPRSHLVFGPRLRICGTRLVFSNATTDISTNSASLPPRGSASLGNMSEGPHIVHTAAAVTSPAKPSTRF